MNKTYATIIFILLILVVAVGGYAFYKANKQQVGPKNNVVQNITPTPSKPPISPSVTPVSNPATSQIPLTVSTVKDGDKVSLPSLTLSGTTVPKADVNINGTDYVANSQGKFSATIKLDEGENSLVITATDENGNVGEWNATVTYELAQ